MPKESWLVRISVLLTVLVLVQLGLLAFQAQQIHELREDVGDLQKTMGGRGRGSAPGKNDAMTVLGRQIEGQSQATQ